MIVHNQFEDRTLILYRVEEIYGMDVSCRYRGYEQGSISRGRNCWSCFAMSRHLADNNYENSTRHQASDTSDPQLEKGKEFQRIGYAGPRVSQKTGAEVSLSTVEKTI